MFSVDVIIPTYKPKKDFLEVLDLLNKQTMKPGRIILMNTEEYYFDQFIYMEPIFCSAMTIARYIICQSWNMIMEKPETVE